MGKTTTEHQRSCRDRLAEITGTMAGAVDQQAALTVAGMLRGPSVAPARQFPLLLLTAPKTVDALEQKLAPSLYVVRPGWSGGERASRGAPVMVMGMPLDDPTLFKAIDDLLARANDGQ